MRSRPTRCGLRSRLLGAAASLVWTACGNDGGADTPERRSDGARALAVDAGPSLQNPCFSADGRSLIVTRWMGGYNEGRAVVGIVPSGGGTFEVLTDLEAVSVNLPGSCHSAAGDRIVFSSDSGLEHDEIWVMSLADRVPRQVTDRADAMAFEPSISPDGEWIVFESHPLDIEDQGALFKVRVDGSELTRLTDGSGDDRQPNWSPAGDVIVFQSHGRVPGNIEIFAIDPDGNGLRNVTDSPSEDTDAAPSADGTRVVYSSDRGGLELPSLFVKSLEGGAPERLTSAAAYDGAPAWSPDGRTVAFESYAGDPDGTSGTALYVVDAP